MSATHYFAAAAVGWVALSHLPNIRTLIYGTALIALVIPEPAWLAATVALFTPAALGDLRPRTHSRTGPSRSIPNRDRRRGRVPRRNRDPLRQATPAMRAHVLRRDGHRCVYCGAGGPGTELHLDHIIPWAHGGRTLPSNLQTLCREHNLKKSTRSDRWMRFRYIRDSGFAPLDTAPTRNRTRSRR